MNLNQLLIFDTIAAQGNVTRAAEKLLVSQPAVSKQLKELEKSLGTPLFERTSKGMRLTSVGEVLVGYSRRIFALEAEAEQALNDLDGLRRGRLSVAASTTVGVYLLPDVFVHFRRQHPGIQLHLDIAGSEEIHQRLLRGQVDFGLTEGVVEADDVQTSIEMTDRLVAIAPPDHPLARRRSVTAEALCREPFVVRETGSGSKSMVEKVLAKRGLAVKPVMSLGNTEAIKKAVAAGVGVAIVSSLSVVLEAQAKRLAVLKLSGLQLQRPIYLITRPGGPISAAAREFLKTLRRLHGSQGREPSSGSAKAAAMGVMDRAAAHRGGDFPGRLRRFAGGRVA